MTRDKSGMLTFSQDRFDCGYWFNMGFVVRWGGVHLPASSMMVGFKLEGALSALSLNHGSVPNGQSFYM